MIDRVVYLLGAGFSAPLGLPLISNFLLKSKDLYYTNPQRFAHFEHVFSTINDLSVVKNYLSANLLDIEEILSILEMNAHLEGNALADAFTKYIRDVIDHFTPELVPYPRSELPANWATFVFGRVASWRRYGHFIASLHSLRLRQERGRSGRQFHLSKSKTPLALYDVVSLNYDCVLEKAMTYLNDTFGAGTEFRFRRAHEGAPANVPHQPTLAKLHGSVDSGVIVPPTWKKAATPEIEAQWNAAHSLLIKANHIRVIGYSLPPTDAYVQ